jgi:hypothetical protein
MLWLLCPRLNQSRNDHSIEKVVVSRGHNTRVVLRTKKINSKIEFKIERLLNVPPYFTTKHSAVCLQLVFVCFVRSVIRIHNVLFSYPALTDMFETTHTAFSMNYVFQDHAVDQVVSHRTYRGKSSSIPGQCMCSLWWTNWQWDRLSSGYFRHNLSLFH